MSRLILNAVDGYLPDIVVVDSGPEVSPGADDVLVEIEAARSTAQTSSSQPAGRAGIRMLAVVRREEAADEVRRLGAEAVVVDG